MTRRNTTPPGRGSPVNVFVSYSHMNKMWFERLRPVLKFQDSNVIHVWHDTELQSGHRWDDEIRAALQAMDVFLCLVSHYFLASDYIEEVELKEALKRARRREVEIVPLLLYPVDLAGEHSKLKDYNPLPGFGKSWHDLCGPNDDFQVAHSEIRRGLRQAIDRVLARRVAT